MRKKIKGSEHGLENGTLILDFLFKSKYIHYGYFSNNLEQEFWNVGKAQQAYTDELLSIMPSNVKTILDVGCGTGMVAKSLIELGFQIECISPSPFLAQKAKENNADLIIHECKFEDFKPTKKYDLVLFCESYQYIKLNNLLTKLEECITANGFLMLSDVFKTNPNDRGSIGGGHLYSDHIEICKKFNYKLITDKDVTANIAPTFDLINSLETQLIKPLFDNFIRIFSVNRPILAKIVLFIFRKQITKAINKVTRKDRNGSGFKKFNTYRMQIWKK